MTLILNTLRDFTLGNFRRVAWEGEAVALSPDALARMMKERRRFERLIEEPSVTIYGVTSGYGQHAKKRLTPEERKRHAKVPPVQSAASSGDPVPQRVARGIVFARLANFIEGHSAITPAIAEAVAQMLDGRAVPAVPARGQGGAGEILSLSHLFASFAANPAIAEKDLLSLINGSPSASALTADAALAARARLGLAVEVFALSAEAFNTPLSHFAEALEGLWNNKHDAWALRRLRELIGDGHGGERRPYQAPVSYRILPRMLGQAQRAAVMAGEVAEESLSAVTDNPVMLPADDNHPDGEVISTGGYHNPHAVMAMDAVAASAANLVVLAGRHADKLLNGAVSLLPDQLGLGNSTDYLGCLPFASAGYEEEARLMAQTTLLPGAETGGYAQNDVASPIFLSWTKQEKTGALLEAALANLAMIAIRALDLTSRPVPPALAGLESLIRPHLPPLQSGVPPGPVAAKIEAALRRRVYGVSSEVM
jgi:histidine ammonia-lyase